MITNHNTENMRIINVVKIINCVVYNIESFGVFEEQFVNDVQEIAEKEFIKQAQELGLSNEESEVENAIENGYFECTWDDTSNVCISWSYINE